MSNINQITAAEELFTELTPEQGAVVEGGATLQVRYLIANKPSQNDPVIQAGRGTVFAKDNVNTTQKIFKTVKFTGKTTLSIWDRDQGAYNDDLLGFVNLSQAPTGVKSLKVNGYTLTYRVF
ncbi:hypothetical protein BJP34_25140 [Moorena producens PAL-8-15-08-1]|uniref:Uncharacterized protein n=1 Tax=Moorena producens PAL-8-15-08-1 TaxID=1458985 RepID=A0A1D8TXA7_9CYAN|nr:hypothetical protein [Moorena producens]AOX02287.1 hypothetical protein BJP34_25115 [Moorena producens PAL-8-15-08-1]AOX02289.1 hypothetical protein BJP34_25125 [Moorena producens PAL-8-15-08-1]AOX02292.1 hypothetical protein BJP34_25140 [Moorena producens PAL-8-15-08-1]